MDVPTDWLAGHEGAQEAGAAPNAQEMEREGRKGAGRKTPEEKERMAAIRAHLHETEAGVEEGGPAAPADKFRDSVHHKREEGPDRELLLAAQERGET